MRKTKTCPDCNGKCYPGAQRCLACHHRILPTIPHPSLRLGSVTEAANARKRAAERISILDDYRALGRSPEDAARALGLNPQSLERWCHRRDRHDLARWMARAARTAA